MLWRIFNETFNVSRVIDVSMTFLGLTDAEAYFNIWRPGRGLPHVINTKAFFSRRLLETWGLRLCSLPLRAMAPLALGLIRPRTDADSKGYYFENQIKQLNFSRLNWMDYERYYKRKVKILLLMIFCYVRHNSKVILKLQCLITYLKTLL